MRRPKPQAFALQAQHPLVHGRSLVGAWLLTGPDGVGAKYRDLSTTRAHGTPTNTPTQQVGRYGRETLFTTGSSQYIACGNPSALQITQNITISTSYKLTSVPGSGSSYIICAKDFDGGSRPYTLDLQNQSGADLDSGLRFYVNGGSGGYILKEHRLPVAGDDRNVVVQYRSSDGLFRIFVNGVLVNNSTLGASSIPNSAANFAIGRREYAGFEGYFDGSIRYVYVWADFLSANEIADHNVDPIEIVRPKRRRSVRGAVAAVSVTPTTATLTLTTYAPTVLTPRVCIPTTATLTLTTYAPRIGTGVIPTTRALTLTTYAPTVQTPRVCIPTTRALTLTTYAPTVLTPRTVTPTTAALVLTGYAPTVLTPRTAIPTTAALTTTTYAPTVRTALIVFPGVATLTLTGYAPTIVNPKTVTPSTAALTVTGYAPTVSVEAPSSGGGSGRRRGKRAAPRLVQTVGPTGRPRFIPPRRQPAMATLAAPRDDEEALLVLLMGAAAA